MLLVKRGRTLARSVTRRRRPGSGDTRPSRRDADRWRPERVIPAMGLVLLVAIGIGTVSSDRTDDSGVGSGGEADVSVAPATALPAFPGAQGFGANTPGGRGGRVIEVTSLDDSGPGTLRRAMEASGPRIVVFRTGGTIRLHGEIDVRNPFLTIAGQSAPGDGITLRATPGNSEGLVDLHTHDVVIRFVRFRQGAHTKIDAAIPLALERSWNVVIDHCSFSWATDENLTVWDDTSNVTISWNIISEGLSHSTHYDGEHSRGLFLSGDRSRDISAHHNLMTHNMRRNPEVNTEGTADIRNNVAYDWGTHAAQFSDKRGRHGVNVVGNYFKPGPSTSEPDRYELDVYPYGHGGAALYVTGNIGPHRPRSDLPDRDSVDPEGRRWLVSNPHPAPPVTTTSAAQAYDDVLAKAGVRVPTLDAVDERIIREVKNGTGRIIDDPDDVGGWPDLRAGTPPPDTDHDGMPNAWEQARGLNPRRDDSAGKREGLPYTNVEEYLDGLVPAQLERAGSS